MFIEKAIEFYGELLTGPVIAYLAALAATIVYALVWQFVARPRGRTTDEPLSATELAYLRSEIAPVVTALAELRAQGRIDQNGVVHSSAHPDLFTNHILRRIALNPDHTVSRLYHASGPQLDALEERLSARGLTRTRAERKRMRWAVAPMLAVMAVGVGFCLYHVTPLSGPGIDVASIMFVAIPTVCVAVGVLPSLLDVNRLTWAGRRRLAAEKKRLAYLEPKKRPAFATYGPAAVGMSAALFGTGVLWAVDSDYSSSVELAGESASGGGCGASCGGDGGGCGGGGCGGCGGGGGGCGG
ncbi:MAG: TIGR04222 domain-containing membrane protein [Leucobacter sp.]